MIAVIENSISMYDLRSRHIRILNILFYLQNVDSNAYIFLTAGSCIRGCVVNLDILLKSDRTADCEGKKYRNDTETPKLYD